MNKKLKFIFICLFSLLAVSCSKEDELLIRVINVSEYNYENVIINSENFGDINADERSDYIAFEMAYRYSYIDLEINGEGFTQIPIDYVGETPLSNGKYSYLIDVGNFDERRLTQTLVEDD